MVASGTFDVDLTPQDDPGHQVGRMLIDKVYHGDVVGSGTGQMISKRTETGVAAYSAVEEFSGSIDDKTGGFTLLHQGQMSPEYQRLEVVILEGSGSGDFENVSGSMRIAQDENGHTYELTYEL